MLVHIAFRKLIAEPDQILAQHGLSRVHHRIMFIIGRNPGLSISDLLDQLQVSRQALHRPLKQLTDLDLVETQPLPENRRIHQLLLTKKGAILEDRVSGLQRDYCEAAFSAENHEAEMSWRRIMARLGHGT